MSSRLLLDTCILNTESIIANYAEIDHFSGLLGHKMGKNDVWIAATAKSTGYQLMTMDRDFDHLDKVHLSLIFIDPESHRLP